MHSTGLIPLASDHIVPPSVTRSGCSNRPPSAVPVCHHSPVLAVYCRLPLFLKGDKGLFLAPVPPAEFPEVRLEDMFPGLAGSNWEKKSWVSQSCGWRSGDKRHSERGQERRPGTDRRGRMEHRCWEFKGVGASQGVRVWVCVDVSRDFQSGWCSVGLRSIPLHRNSPRPLRKTPVPELQHWWRVGLWWRGPPPARHAPFTCTLSTTTLSTIAQSCCCHSNHKSKCGQASEEKSCGYSETEVVKVNSTHSVFANHLLSSQSLQFRAETEQLPSNELNTHYYDEYWDFSFLFTKNTNAYYT